MFKHNDTIIPLDTPFEINGTSYPANWLRLTSTEEKNAVGIMEVAEEMQITIKEFTVIGKKHPPLFLLINGMWGATIA